MRIKALLLAACLSATVCGCVITSARHIGYDIVTNAQLPADLGTMRVIPFTDERPKQEREGVKGKLLTFSSKDANFTQPVPLAVEEILSEELHNAGFSIVAQGGDAQYTVSGAIKHFQVIMSPAKITFLPYLATVASLWTKDEFTLALSIYIQLRDAQQNTLIDKTFDVSEEMKLPTGLLSLARYARGTDYKLKLLDEALKDAIEQIKEEAVAKAKNN
ncbi:MAG: hypothetical protein V1727_06855 [Candidatus Omnitrophota bacterium]